MNTTNLLTARSSATRRASSAPFIALTLALVARLTIGIRQRLEFTQIDDYAMAQVAIIMITMAALLIYPYLGQMLRKMCAASAGLFMLYYIVGIVSTAWSPLPAFSLFRAVEVLSQILSVFIIICMLPKYISAERMMIILLFAILALSLVGYIKLVGFSTSLAGWHTNGYTASAAMLACYCIGELLAKSDARRRKLLKWGAAVGFFCIILGTSSGSVIATFAGLGVAAIAARRYGLLATTLVLLAVAVAMGASDELFGVIFPNKSKEAVESFSGRMALWESYWVAIKESFILGQGFAVMPRLITTTAYTTNSHNSLIAAMGSTGLVGLIVLLFWMIRFGREALYSLRVKRIGSAGCAAGIAAGMINSFSCAFVGENWTPMTFSFCLLLALHHHVNNGPFINTHASPALQPTGRQRLRHLRGKPVRDVRVGPENASGRRTP